MEVLKQEKVLSLSFLICHNCSYHPHQVGGDPTELCLFWFHSHISIFQSMKFDSIKMAWVAFPPFLPPQKVWAHGGLYVGSKIKVKTRNMTIKSTRVTINFQSSNVSALNSEEFDQCLRNTFQKNSINRLRKVSQNMSPSKSWRRIGVPWQVFESCKTWCRITRSKEGCLPFLGSCSLFCGRQALDHFASVRFFPQPTIRTFSWWWELFAGWSEPKKPRCARYKFHRGSSHCGTLWCPYCTTASPTWLLRHPIT